MNKWIVIEWIFYILQIQSTFKWFILFQFRFILFLKERLKWNESSLIH